MKTCVFRVIVVVLPLMGIPQAGGATPADAVSPDCFPPPGAVNVCPDAPLRLTFPSAVTLGTGSIDIRSAADDALLDSIPLNAASGRGLAPGRGAPGAASSAAAPIAGVSSIRTPGQVLPREPLTPGLPTRGKTIGGTGFVTYPVMVFGKEVLVFPASTLPFNKSVYVKIAPGTFRIGDSDDPGIPDAKTWRFTTKAAPPAADAPRITVAADGTGDFCTVQAAVDSIPAGNTAPHTIFIRSGVYYEIINFAGKNNLTFLGEDRKKTILAYPNNNNFSSSPPSMTSRASGAAGAGISSRRGLFNAQRASDLTLANLTFHNTTPQGGSQAEAIILGGTATARAILTNVDLYSFQDTLQINGQAYLSHCTIEGDVDFMWGTGPCFFEDCRATTVRSNAYYTQIRNTAANRGYVYRKCVFDGAPGITGNVLSRIDPTRFPASEVVLLDCTLTGAVSDVAWRFDGANPAASNTHFWEYVSRTPAGDPVDTTKRFPASRRLTLPEDAELIKNYSDPQWVLGGWSPRLAPIITAQPASVTCAAGQKVTFSVEVAAVPDATYQWYVNGVFIWGADKGAFTLDAASAGSAGRYSCVVSNAAGKVTSEPAGLTVSPPG